MSELCSPSVLSRRLPVVTLVFSTLLNIALGGQLYGAKTTQASIHEPKAGMMVAPFEGSTPNGQRIAINFDHTVPTILYHFSPTCSWCERNWENVKALVAQTKGRYRFVGISQKRVTPGFLRERSLDIDVAAELDIGVAERLLLGGTPQTIVVSTTGIVLQTWTGAFIGRQLNAVQRVFGVRLPGIRSAEPAG